jgi:hypothetical protein
MGSSVLNDPTAFAPWIELESALRRNADEGKPPYALAAGRREVVTDLALVPPNATFLATRGTAAHLARISELHQLEALWANPASPELFRACASARSLRAIFVCHLKRMSEVPLSGAPGLEHLMLRWAPRVSDLSFLQDLPALRTIYLDDLKRLDLDSLPHLPNVTGCYIGGGMWTALKVDSLEPLTRLSGLRHLTIENVRPRDGRLTSLGELRNLRELYLPNFFEIDEVARLAALLPGVVSNILGPVYGRRDVTRSPWAPFICPICGRRRDMMTGKPASILCAVCNARSYQRRLARWEAALTDQARASEHCIT